MKGLYDIHCHILPGVDDGARNMEESLWMLNKEWEGCDVDDPSARVLSNYGQSGM